MALTDRFNQEIGPGYGACGTCGIDLQTEVDANEHMSATFKDTKAQGGSSGHGVQVLNPTRERRISTEVGSAVADAIEGALDEMDRLVDSNQLTKEEITEALRGYPDFADAWEDRNNE
jgi:hypothetical protein